MKRLLIVASLLLSACATEDSGPVGDAIASITQVPSNVACVQIQVVGSRTETRNVDTVPGKSSVVPLNGLPAGADTFTAVAFAQACNALGASSIASWQSDPVVAVIAGGATTPLKLALHPVGNGSVSIDFQDDGGAPPSDLSVSLLPFGASCTSSAQCQSGACQQFQSGTITVCTKPCTVATQAVDCPSPPSTGTCNLQNYCKF
jgi:hypothetical protein